MRDLIGWISLAPERAVSFIAQTGLDTADLSQGLSPFVAGSVLWSLYAFLRTPQDYLQTVHTAIAADGDVDTTAAMAGAMSGAHLGLHAIPDHWGQRITDQGTWSHDELVELANQSYELKMAAQKERWFESREK